MSLLIITCYDESIYTDLKEYEIERIGTNKPELRQKLIMEYLSEKNNTNIVHVSFLYDSIKNEKLLKSVHGSDYIEFLKNAYDSYLKYQDCEYKAEDDSGLIPSNFTKNKNNLHKLEYYRQTGLYATDLVTPIYQNTFTVINYCVNVAIETQQYVDKYKTIYCSMTHPGHHAKTNEYGGYCFINNACIVGEVNSENFNHNVCFLDLDYHAGNGTHEIVERYVRDRKKKRNYLSVSIHADPKYEYPSFECYEDENTDHVVNIVFPKKSTIDEYMACLSSAIDIIKKRFESKEFLLIIPFGADTYIKDIDVSKLYGCGLELSDYEKIGNFIREKFKDTTIIITQEGGYFMEDVPQIVHNFLSGISKEK